MASSQAGVAVEIIDGTFPVPTMFSGWGKMNTKWSLRLHCTKKLTSENKRKKESRIIRMYNVQ